MQLQGRNLRLDLRGADVRLLQFELRLLGLNLPEEEALENRFGEGTQQGLPASRSKPSTPQRPAVILKDGDLRRERHLNAQVCPSMFHCQWMSRN